MSVVNAGILGFGVGIIFSMVHEAVHAWLKRRNAPKVEPQSKIAWNTMRGPDGRWYWHYVEPGQGPNGWKPTTARDEPN